MPPAANPSAARRTRTLPPLLLAAGLLALAGCTAPNRAPVGPKPDRTRLESRLIVLPATTIGGHLVVESRNDRRSPARFLIDTGSSVTLLSPEFAAQVGSNPTDYEGPQVRVRGADGRTTTLASVAVRRLDLGAARFENVQALLYDLSDLSAHLGVKIDGVLGFPLFRDTLLTLDYPGSRVVLTPASENVLSPGSAFSFNTSTRVPLIPVQVGDRTLLVLIDSGSDGPLNLNPFGLAPNYASPPRPATRVTTLTGAQQPEIARLAETLRLGDYSLPRPIVQLTDQLSSIGGGVLRHFSITFDQTRGRVTFYRESLAPIESAARRSSGLGFARTPAYWRVDGVIPGSPAEAAGIRTGDLVVRIDGEPVERWNLTRLDERIRTADRLELTFIEGRTETTRSVAIFDLVP